MTKPKKGREIAVARLVEGKILSGETITIDTVVPQLGPRRQTYRGMVYHIEDDTAYMCIFGQREVIMIYLEPEAA
jgi:hypothetical protein